MKQVKDMEKRKNIPAVSNANITLKESPRTTAMKNIPDDVIIRAIREVLHKNKEKK